MQHGSLTNLAFDDFANHADPRDVVLPHVAILTVRHHVQVDGHVQPVLQQLQEVRDEARVALKTAAAARRRHCVRCRLTRTGEM